MSLATSVSSAIGLHELYDVGVVFPWHSLGDGLKASCREVFVWGALVPPRQPMTCHRQYTEGVDVQKALSLCALGRSLSRGPSSWLAWLRSCEHSLEGLDLTIIHFKSVKFFGQPMHLARDSAVG